jgi:hypothetical protein
LMPLRSSAGSAASSGALRAPGALCTMGIEYEPLEWVA